MQGSRGSVGFPWAQEGIGSVGAAEGIGVGDFCCIGTSEGCRFSQKGHARWRLQGD